MDLSPHTHAGELQKGTKTYQTPQKHTTALETHEKSRSFEQYAKVHEYAEIYGNKRTLWHQMARSVLD